MAPGAHPGPPACPPLGAGSQDQRGPPGGCYISCPAGDRPPPGGHRAGRAHGARSGGSLVGAVKGTPTPWPSQPEAPACGRRRLCGWEFPNLGGPHRSWLPRLGSSPRTRSCSLTMGSVSGLPWAPWGGVGWGGEGGAPGGEGEARGLCPAVTIPGSLLACVSGKSRHPRSARTDHMPEGASGKQLPEGSRGAPQDLPRGSVCL